MRIGKPRKTLAAALALSLLSTAAFSETVLEQALSTPDPTFDGRHGAHAAALAHPMGLGVSHVPPVRALSPAEKGVSHVPPVRTGPPTENGVPSVPALHGLKPPVPPKPDVDPKPSPSRPGGAWKERLRDGLARAKSGLISAGKKALSAADKIQKGLRSSPFFAIGVSAAAAAVGFAVAGPAGAAIAAGATMIFMIGTSP